MTKPRAEKQRIPIPQDWNGKDWFCIQLQWPASPQFIAVLTGLLSQVTRGWFWNEQTGAVKDAQQTGIEIWNRNILFAPCSDNGDTTPTPTPETTIGGGILEMEEEDVPAITWLSIEDGLMYMHFGPCCKVLVDGDYTDLLQPSPDGETPDPNDPATWSCNKAAGIAGYLVALMEDLDTAIGGNSSVYESYQAAHAVLSPHNSTWQTSQLVTAAYFADKSANQALIASADTPGYMACHWDGLLVDTDTINESEFYTMQTSRPPSFTSEQAMFLTRMLQAVGISTLAWWARLTHDDAANCECPGTTPFEDWASTFDWVIDWNFANGRPFGTELRVDNGITGMVATGVTMTNNTTGSETLGVRRPPSVLTGYLENYYVEWYMGLPFVAVDWGINGQTVGVAEMKYDVVDDGGNNYHILYENVHRLIDDIGGDFGCWSFQGSYDDTKTPAFPVITRLVMAGNGAHPFGG